MSTFLSEARRPSDHINQRQSAGKSGAGSSLALIVVAGMSLAAGAIVGAQVKAVFDRPAPKPSTYSVPTPPDRIVVPFSVIPSLNSRGVTLPGGTEFKNQGNNLTDGQIRQALAAAAKLVPEKMKTIGAEIAKLGGSPSVICPPVPSAARQAPLISFQPSMREISGFQALPHPDSGGMIRLHPVNSKKISLFNINQVLKSSTAALALIKSPDTSPTVTLPPTLAELISRKEFDQLANQITAREWQSIERKISAPAPKPSTAGIYK